MAHVVVFGPGLDAAGRQVPLVAGELVLGRDPASDLVLDHYRVSRRHASFRPGPEGWEVHDIGSSNGIRVQGHRMEAALLRDGDEVLVGPFRLVFAGDAAGGLPPVPRQPPPPALPSPAARSRPARARRSHGGLALAALAVALLLPAAVAGFVLLRGPAAPPRGETAAVAPPEPTPAAPALPDDPLPPAADWPPAPDAAVAAEVDRAATALEKALAASDVEQVLVRVHPAAAEDLRSAFEPRRSELPRVASLLATRRLVVAEEAWAEYEVAEDGRSYSVVFEKVEGRWLLSWL